MAHHRVQNVRDEVKEGDQVLVKVISIDPSGKIRLSRKALLAEEEGGESGSDASTAQPSEHAHRPHRPQGAQDRGHDRGHGSRGGRPGGSGSRDRHR
jgi:polyribonucleotide nucleotidyltransferase